MWVEEGGVAKLEEALQVRREVMFRALRGRGLEHTRRHFS